MLMKRIGQDKTSAVSALLDIVKKKIKLMPIKPVPLAMLKFFLSNKHIR